MLLCGYPPFRGDDTKTLIRETSEAKIDFQDRYWKNISLQAKTFIKRLLNPDPAERPTAEEAYNNPVSGCGFLFLLFFFFCGGGLKWLTQWLTIHEPSTEHDLSTGLRDNFDAKARWKSAIGAVRGIRRCVRFL